MMSVLFPKHFLKMLTCERYLLISRDHRYLVFSAQSALERGSVWEFDLREMNVLKTESLLKDISAFSLIFGQDISVYIYCCDEWYEMGNLDKKFKMKNTRAIMYFSKIIYSSL